MSESKRCGECSACQEAELRPKTAPPCRGACKARHSSRMGWRRAPVDSGTRLRIGAGAKGDIVSRKLTSAQIDALRRIADGYG